MAREIKYQRPWLYPKQLEAIFHDRRYGCIEASTKAGKTVGCICWLFEQAAIHGCHGKNYWWVAPIFPQAKIAFRRLKRYLPLELYVANETELTITLINGAVIWFKGADKPDSLYGEDVYAAVLDEASRMKEDAWIAVRSTLTATRGPVRLIGNVKGRRNFFYNLSRKAESGEPNMAYHVITAYDAVAGGVVTLEEIEDAKRLLPEQVFNELYLCKPSDDGGNPFGLKAIREAVAPLSNLPAACWGIDLAKSHDWTVAIGLDQHGLACRFERFQKPWQDTIQTIRDLVGSTPALVDSTGVGDPVLEALQDGRGNFEGFKFSSQSKQQLMEGLAVAIQRRQVAYPEGIITMELEQFEYKYTRTGVRYSAPEGLHDDCVCALALAAWHRNAPKSELRIRRLQMAWFRKKQLTQPEEKSLSVGGYYFGTRLLTPPAASYARLAAEGYGQNAVAFACVNRIANAVASVELQLFRQDGGDTDRIEQSPLLDLLDRPNPLQSGREFLGHLASYYALSGNAYVHGPGIGGRRTPPKQLYLLSPGHVAVTAGLYLGLPKEYVYTPNGSTRITYPVDQLTAGSEILHVRTFNPLSPWYGLPPMEAAALAIDQHNAGNVWNYSLLKQGARPSGALVVTGKDGQPATLTDDQYARLKAQMDEGYAGASNSGKPLLLEGGLDWKEMSLSPKDADFLEGKHSAAREIALAFGVPPQLLGIPGDATYSNYEMATLAFWTETVLPVLQLIIGGLNRWLTPAYGDGLYLWYDEEMIPALEPLRKARSDRVNVSGFMTINEKRRAMGLDDAEGGDVILVPSTAMPLDMAGDLGLAEPGSGENPEDEDAEQA